MSDFKQSPKDVMTLRVIKFDSSRCWYRHEATNFILQPLNDRIKIIGKLIHHNDNRFFDIIPLTAPDIIVAHSMGLYVDHSGYHTKRAK